MPRKLRVIAPEWPVHIVQRGSDRMNCFREERDYLVYLAILRQMAEKTVCAVHAYCLMTNHVHLLVTPTAASSCSMLMKGLAQRYSYYFNHEYGRTGPLWEGRFRSCVIDDSRYALACHRYIEANPVRARMVRHPADYRWSSYPANAGLATAGLVSVHSEVAAIGNAAYADLAVQELEDGVIAELREASRGGYPVSKRNNQGKPGRPAKENKSVSDPDLFSAGGAS